MATKADFTEEEWKHLQKGVTGAGLLVSMADRGFFDSFKEAGALAHHLADAREHADNELIREISHVKGTGGFGVTERPDRLEHETMDALHAAVATLQAKAPDALGPYRDLVLDVAQSVAAAAGGGDAAEGAAIGQIRSALGADGSPA